MAKPSPYPKKWTLLFLGSHGRTLHFHHFKLVLVLIVAAFTVTAGTALYFYLQYRHQSEHLRSVERSLTETRKSVRSLKDDNQALTLQLALKHAQPPASKEPVSESAPKAALSAAEKKAAAEAVPPDRDAAKKPSDAVAEKDPAPPASVTAAPAVETPPEQAPEVSAPETVPIQMPKRGEPSQPTENNSEAPQAQAAATPPRPPAMVDVTNFRLRKDPARDRWTIRFTIKRTAAASGKIRGRAFIVLEDGGNNFSNWVCVPPATLIEGKPTPEQRGYTFAISNYLNARLSMKRQVPPENVKAAVVYVYNEKGSLLLEQRFPIDK